MALAKRDEGAKVNSNINVTPMVDVMLVLLIIFMVITPMLQKDVTVDLAKVQNPEQMTDADKEDSIVVAITRDGSIFLGRDNVQPDQLTNKIKDRIASRVDKRVYVRSDARAKYKNVVEVVDNVRAAGVDDLGLLTEQRKQQPVRPPGGPNAPSATAGGTQ
jgi:biopolymer transport protein TolR